MLIRYMEERDIPVVARLEQEAFSEPWSEKAFHDSMKLSYSLFLVAEEEEELAGYAGMYLVADEETKEGILIDCAGAIDKIYNYVENMNINLKYFYRRYFFRKYN